MTEWEGRILSLMADRFPSSAAALGGRGLRLRPRLSFPQLASSGPDAAESFLEAAEGLEAHGILSIQWKRHRKGQEIEALVLSDPGALYRLLDRPLPASVLEAARAACREAAREGGPSAAFFAFLEKSLGPEDAASGMDDAFIRALARLASSMEGRLVGGELSGISLRALSVSLFADSKRIEELLRRARPLLSRAAEAGARVPDFSGLERSFPDTMVSGRLILDLGAPEPLVNASGLPLGLPGESARALRSVRLLDPGTEPRALFVENKESFHALAARAAPGAPFPCLVYSGGHPNPAVARVARILAASGFALHHSGDLDPEGILILQEIAEAAGAPVMPHRMDAPTFDRYLPWGYDLDAPRLSRIARLSDDTRRLPGIEALLGRILSSGKGVEQEIIEY